jgi:hypothetical protein
VIKYIFIVSFLVFSINTAFSQFVVKDILAVHPQASIFDPEYNTNLNLVCWKSDDDDLWVSGLDPVTHLFEPSDGKGTFVTANLAPNGAESWNGPEWMLSSLGTQIVYLKAIWGIRYLGIATRVFGGWQTFTNLQYPNVVYAMATSNYADSTACLLFETSANDGISWLRNTDFWTRYFYPEITLGFFARDNQQICCATDKSRNPGFVETACNLPYFTSISNDTIGAPCMWNDPATNTRLFMYRTNGFKTLKIFQEVAPDFWALSKQFNSPLPDPYNYITSPEPFTCSGHSYISFMAAQSSSGKDGLPAQIWIASADPSDSLMRRVSDSTLGIRTDPEPVVFSDSAFIYYTDVISGKSSPVKYSVRKCDTGLGNLFTSVKGIEMAGEKISVFPNPNNGRFKIEIGNQFGSAPIIKVYDIQGNEVYRSVAQSRCTEMQLEGLPSGNYCVKVEGNKQQSAAKFTIVR